MVGGIGGLGGMGGMGGGGAVAGAGVVSAAPAVGAGMGVGGAGATSAPTSMAPSTKVTISDAGKSAASEAPVSGASFSVSQDASGHHYVGGTDANGFSNMSNKPMEMVGTGGVSHSGASGLKPLGDFNANGQSIRELNVMSDLVAALLLALMLKHKNS